MFLLCQSLKKLKGNATNNQNPKVQQGNQKGLKGFHLRINKYKYVSYLLMNDLDNSSVWK